jgi:hypothetical protein
LPGIEISPAAGRRRGHAEGRAGEAGENCRSERDADGVTRAVEDAGQHVAAEIIRAEQKAIAHRAEHVGIDDIPDLVRGEARTDQRDDEPECDDGEPDEPGQRHPQASPRSPRVRWSCRRGRIDVAAHAHR